MAVLKHRQRIVTFRVSTEEYETLEHSCIASGARSISDFARSSVLYQAKMLAVPQGLLMQDLATLSRDLAGLDATLRDLRLQIRKVLGSVQPEDDSQAGANLIGER